MIHQIIFDLQHTKHQICNIHFIDFFDLVAYNENLENNYKCFFYSKYVYLHIIVMNLLFLNTV